MQHSERTAMNEKMKIIRTVDKDGREVFTYLKKPAPCLPTNSRRKKRNEALRVTLKLPR
jgi:hypothetical protein